MLKIIVVGAAGKMGQRICALIEKNPKLAKPLKATRNFPLAQCIETGDMIIDFSSIEATLQAIPLAVKYHKPIVIGTTGLSGPEMDLIRNAAKVIPVVYSSNMSLGVNVLWKLLETAAHALKKYWHVAISETHHVHKKDSPSGTAKTMADICEKILGMRPTIDATREGEVVGDHSAVFDSALEALQIRHHAKSRDVFAAGAITAALWLVGKKPGLYTMGNVLGLI